MGGSRGTCVLMVLLLACGGDPPTENNQPDGGGEFADQITVNDDFFAPSAATVPPGTTVTWTWVGGNVHNVQFANTAVGNSPLQSTGTFSRTFATAGTFAYLCSVHGSAMSGTITVQ